MTATVTNAKAAIGHHELISSPAGRRLRKSTSLRRAGSVASAMTACAPVNGCPVVVDTMTSYPLVTWRALRAVPLYILPLPTCGIPVDTVTVRPRFAEQVGPEILMDQGVARTPVTENDGATVTDVTKVTADAHTGEQSVRARAMSR